MIGLIALLNIVQATGEAVLEKTVSELGLQLCGCIAFSCDGAPFNVGVHDPVWSCLHAVRAQNSKLAKCTCHSQALCV